MKLLKGVTVSIFLFLLCIVAPFNIHAAGETQIVPTYTNSTTQQEWQTKIKINNYCEGTNASTASCKLTFYVTGNYYGIIYVDGYDSSGTHWMNGTSIFVSGGYGEYNYNFYQNGIKAISSISIWGVSLVEPDSNVDLTQIIQLLTSINNYENRNNVLLDVIDDNTLNTVNEIKNVLSQLIISNGYLETLTKLRQFNIPFESISSLYYPMDHYQTYDLFNINAFNYPLFNISIGSIITRFHCLSNTAKRVIILINRNTYNISTLLDNIEISSSVDGVLTSSNISNFKQLKTFYNTGFMCLVSFEVNNISNGVLSISSKYNGVFCPIFEGYLTDKYISTDFALLFGLSNSLLDNLNIIANGTSSSNQQASDLSSGTDSMQQQMNSFTSQEDSYNQQMNNSINAIDFSSPVSQNAGILPAANFVISIFNGLIQNNAFSVLILIVCVLIIGKKVIGK